MNYNETLDFMFSQLPMFQRVGKAAYKADLSNTIELLQTLNNPEKDFKSIHIAGTNGKGSTSHILASIFQEAGYKTGLYTSPHLIDFRERIKINGEMIDESAVVEFIENISSAIDLIHPSFFELTMAMAFKHFSDMKVDIAIVETGLGGRLDSTNVIDPELSIITNIGMDHMQFLGNDRLSIAREKGGIIKDKTAIIIGQADQELKELFSSMAKKKSAAITFAEDEEKTEFPSDLKGYYQKYNIQTAIVALNELKKANWKFTQEEIENGIKNVVKNTGLMGRWQIIGNSPKIICDTAHNKEGLLIVIDQLLKEKYDRLHIIFGLVNDKNEKEILKLFPKKANYYFTQASVPRKLNVDVLEKEATAISLEGNAYLTVMEAFEAARTEASQNDLIFIGGSTFIVADLLATLI